MPEPTLLFIAGVFLFAGTVKGAIGLGMPAIVMGSLALVMTPVEAAAILAAPMLITNIWQMLAGPHFKPLVRRLWPVLLGVLVGTLAGTGWLTGMDPRSGASLLGAVLVVYGLSGFVAVPVAVGAPNERWGGLAAGGVTGLIGAATGVFVIPAVPYLQALRLEKDELVQGLGIFFAVSTLGLIANLAQGSALNWSAGTAALVGLAMACAGMWLGQRVRMRLQPAAFRTAFFCGLLLLGLYLVARSVT